MISAAASSIAAEQTQQHGGVIHRRCGVACRRCFRRPRGGGLLARDGGRRPEPAGPPRVSPTAGSSSRRLPAQRPSAAASSSGLMGFDR